MSHLRLPTRAPQPGGSYIFRPNGTALSLSSLVGGGNGSSSGNFSLPRVSVVRGLVVSEVHLFWTDWASAAVRIYHGQGPFAEVSQQPSTATDACAPGGQCCREPPRPSALGSAASSSSIRLSSRRFASQVAWTAGPIPIDDHLGKSLVLRVSTNASSGGQLWTDSNGREMVLRRRDARRAPEEEEERSLQRVARAAGGRMRRAHLRWVDP